MKKYVMGVDGGGTKSHLAIFDENAVKIDFRAYGTLNHECMSGAFGQLEQELEAFLLGTMRENGVTHEQLAYSVFGLAGVDTKKQHKIISEMLERLGFKNFTLCNDAYLGIPAGSPDGAGICAINGTGCTVAGKDRNGRVMQIGGFGGLSGDLGGGSRMGKDAIGSVYRELFRSGEHTVMTDIIFKSLGIANKYDFTETLIEKIENGSVNISSYNRVLFEAAALGDKAALKILDDIAENYAGAISCMLNELDFPKNEPVNIVLAGSVFARGEHPVMIDSLKHLVRIGNPDRNLNYVTLEKPPVAGAIIWALHEIGAGGVSPRIFRDLV